MATERDVSVTIDPSLQFGEFANAFRVLEEVGGDCYLDFLVYSAARSEAKVVARLRVNRLFLGPIREHLAIAMDCFDDDVGSDSNTMH